MMCPDKDGDDGHDHGSGFADHQSDYRKTDGRRHVVLPADVIDQIDAPHPADLLRQLRYGGDGGLTDSVKIAVDAGVGGGHRNGQRDDAQKGRRAFFHQKSDGDPVRIEIDAVCGGCRQRHGDEKTRPKRAERCFVVAGTGFTGHIFGDGGLYAGNGQCEGERQYGRYQLIDPHAFRTEYVGQKDPIEKADKAA